MRYYWRKLPFESLPHCTHCHYRECRISMSCVLVVPLQNPQDIPALSFAGHRCKGFVLSIVRSTHPHSFRLTGGLALCYLHCPPLSNQTPQRLRVIHGLPIASARASARYYLLGFAGLWARVTIPMRYPQGLVLALIAHRAAHHQ